jgi:cytochrome c-type biogenesis protein CcmE
MTMTPRRKRMLTVVLIVAGVATSVAFALQAFQKNLLYFYSPSQVAAGEAPASRTIRVGGMVEKGSVVREPGSLEVRFTVTDFAHDLPISYTGVLPDLFREGQGIIARGRFGDGGLFVAEEVLAKHDENYMPPEVKDSLRKQHTETASAGPLPRPARADLRAKIHAMIVELGLCARGSDSAGRVTGVVASRARR